MSSLREAPGNPQTAPAPSATVRTAGRAWRASSRCRPVLVLVVLLFGYFSLTQPNFLYVANLQNLLTSVSALWVVAMGMTFVLIAGAIDLSVGANAAFCGVLFAHVVSGHVLPGPIALLISVITGALIGGVINGLLIGRAGLSFFVVTLGLMTALTGVVEIWTNTNSISVAGSTTDLLASGQLLMIIMVASLIIAFYLQQYTYRGRDVFAVGGNRSAAALAGIRTSSTMITVFAVVGGCAGLAGCLSVARIGAATPQVDPNLPLQAIAAVLLGGTSIFGGAGGVGGTAIGVLFIATLQNGLSIAGVQNYWQLVVTGVILVAAVSADRIKLRLRWRAREVDVQSPPAVASAAAPTSS